MKDLDQLPEDRLAELTSCANEDSRGVVEYANKKGGPKVLRDVVELENGDLIVLSEKVEVVGKTYSSGNSSSTTYTYYYERAAITKISSEGSLRWYREIPKLQQGIRGKGRMSYKYILDNENNHHILFLDNPRNLNEPNRKKLAKYLDGQGGNLVRYKIDDTSGDMVPKVLFEVENVNGLSLPEFDCADIRYLKGSDIISEVSLGADSRLIKFSVD